MSSESSRGEVSTRLIVALAIVGVIAVAAVPLGFYVIPKVMKSFAKEKRELLFEETFEELKAGEIPEGWDRSYDWRSQLEENIGTAVKTGCGSGNCLKIKNRPNPAPAANGKRSSFKRVLPPPSEEERNHTATRATKNPRICIFGGRPSLKKAKTMGMNAVTTADRGATRPIRPVARPL